jgi:hypothetical protein
MYSHAQTKNIPLFTTTFSLPRAYASILKHQETGGRRRRRGKAGGVPVGIFLKL